MFPLIKITKDDGYELIVNINQIASILKRYNNSDYEISLANGFIIQLSWKEFKKLDEQLGRISESGD